MTARETQRVIKYRAYDMHFEEMCYVTSMFWPAKKKNGFDIVEGHGVTGTPYRDITITEMNPLMQFTGLLDKHGKEIYEHDILKVDDDYDKYGWAAGMIGRVIFDKGKYMLSDGTSRFFFEDNQMSYVERLGDLYTTPELVDPKMIENGNS